MNASVIVHLQGGPEQALRCFSALAELPEQPHHEVIVVDDASVGLGELFGWLEGDVTILSTPGRVGLIDSVALAAARATGEVLVILSGAPEVDRGWLAPLLDALDDRDVAVAASRTVGMADVHPVAAHAIAVRADDFRALGALPAAPAGLELAALCSVMGRLGHVETAPDSWLRPPGARMAASRHAMGQAPELSIVIPTLDAASERVRRCVAAVQQTTDAPHEIVLLDNGAPPQGFTEPVNAGLRAARGRYLVVMNDDVEPLSGWWPPLRDALDAGERVVFPLTVDGEMRRDFAAWCFAFDRTTLEEFSHAPGEFFDPRLRVWYQDTDLLVRLRAAACPPACVEESKIRHGLSETVASEDPVLRDWVTEQVARDKVAFDAKHPGVLRHAKPIAVG